MSHRTKCLGLLTLVLIPHKVMAQTQLCLTREKFTDLCYSQMISGDFYASNVDYISFLDFLATHYGTPSSGSPAQTFDALSINFQLPFVTSFCYSILGNATVEACHDAFLEGGQSIERFGFDLNDGNSLHRLREMCGYIYDPSIERGWVTPCSSGTESESEVPNIISDKTNVPLADQRGKSRILISIGTLFGILLILICLICCRRNRDKTDDEDNFENANQEDKEEEEDLNQDPSDERSIDYD